MKNHWHLYCDESGTFETLGKKKSIIIGLLVPDNDHVRLGREYEKLKKQLGIKNMFVHGKDLKDNQSYVQFQKNLVDLTMKSSIRVIRMRYEEDITSEFDGDVSEAFACNRYLYMIQALIEHVIFYNPDFFGENVSFSVKPNSRVFPCDTGQVPEMKTLGFHVVKATDPAKNIVSVWNKVGLRVFLNRIRLEHVPHMAYQGTRRYVSIEMPVAKDSMDPFVHWVDVIAGYIMWHRKKSAVKNLLDSLLIDIVYGSDERLYKELCNLFFSGQHKRFIENYLHTIHLFSTTYYRQQLSRIFEKEIIKTASFTLEDLIGLESLADSYLRSASGNWEFVAALVDKILDLTKHLPAGQNQQKIKQLVFRLNNHKLTYHNHRGEVVESWNAVKHIEGLDIKPGTVEDWWEYAAFKNRKAVTAANLFAFEEGNKELDDILNCMDKGLAFLNECSGMNLRQDQLGKLKGTIAQNYAFLAPFNGDLFKRAEAMFLEAKAQFGEPGALLRQNIYLMHLYMDWDRKAELLKVYKEIEANEAVKAFLEKPDPQTAKYMQFVLALHLKVAVYFLEKDPGLLNIHTRENLKKWFGEASYEHPFEFIYAYLGQLAYLQKDKTLGRAYMKMALNIPRKGEKEVQVTFEAIRAQILVRWALSLNALGYTQEAMQKIKNASALMTKIGADPRYSPILEIIDNKPAGGWFKEGYQALLAVTNAGKIEPKHCEAFLRCFTFNYW